MRGEWPVSWSRESGVCVDQGSEKGNRQNSGREKEQEINEGQKGRACVHMKHLAHPKGARELYRDFRQLETARILQDRKQLT